MKSNITRMHGQQHIKTHKKNPCRVIQITNEAEYNQNTTIFRQDVNQLSFQQQTSQCSK